MYSTLFIDDNGTTSNCSWRVFAEGNRYLVLQSKHFEISHLVLKLEKRRRVVSDGTTSFAEVIKEWISISHLVTSAIVNVHVSSVSFIAQRIGITTNTSILGILEPNLCLFRSVSNTAEPSLTRGNIISFEFKIKCGFKSISPFLDESNLFKTRIGRFHLMQLSKMYEVNTQSKNPRWGTLGPISYYDPLDMLSRDPARIKKAIKQLLLTPQNNLRIVYNGRHVFGWDRFDSVLNCFEAFMKNGDVNDGGGGGSKPDKIDYKSSSDCIIDALSKVLSMEEILTQILELQALDVLDVEGVERVFDRLITLVGSEKIALDELTRRMAKPLSSCLKQIVRSMARTRLQRDSGSASTPSKHSLSMNISLDESIFEAVSEQSDEQTFYNAWKLTHCGVEVDDSTRCREAALHMITCLTTDQCLALLQGWLIALGAKDASIIITLQQFSSPHSLINNSCAVRSQSNWLSVQLQTEDTPGRIISCNDATQPDEDVEMSSILRDASSEIQMEYRVTAIDLGPKSVSKVREKIDEEPQLCRRVSLMLSEDSSSRDNRI